MQSPAPSLHEGLLRALTLLHGKGSKDDVSRPRPLYLVCLHQWSSKLDISSALIASVDC